MRRRPVYKPFFLVLCVAAFMAFFYINKNGLQAYPAGDPQAIEQRLDSTDKANNSILPDVELLKKVVEKGKESIPILGWVMSFL